MRGGVAGEGRADYSLIYTIPDSCADTRVFGGQMAGW